MSGYKFKVGSLFAGVGGICLGFKQAKHKDLGYELIWANEIDEYAAETYNLNFKHELIVGDIEKVIDPGIVDKEKEEYKQLLENVKSEKEKEKYKELIQKCEIEKPLYEEKKKQILTHKIDVLNGGFPCQAFSIAGEQKGFEDHRGNLFWNIVNLIKLLDPIHGKPRILFLENVKNLQSHDNGNTYKIIKNELEKVGYVIKEAVLNTMYFSDLPQNRERIYIIGFLNKEDANKFTMFDNLNNYYKAKNPNERIETIKNILDLNLNKDNGAEYYYTKEKYPNYFLTEDEYMAIPKEKRKAIRINLDEQINEEYQFYQVRRGMYVRKNMSNVCPTLTANMGTGGHNVPLIKVTDGIRKLTPEETFKLQGFPIEKGYKLPEKYNNRNYPKSQLYKQAGNAVSVPIIKLIAEELLKVLGREKQENIMD
ncbi:DNA (cytosine-5-)-methyltransferase [Clostridium tetani]|uniref:DNA cytosine methyltransferase n=1 Tax=Clostridium tetani TaxID=1513 RepID=UPI00100B60D6|nr:DNA (cytosine-5-)-methyltransferase [Clostridium tetani]RXM73685.1 DNA (cytosine-5-)-methyltransferase [Clostridium tetani]RYU97800.1 DNA (cytosine-5-)-methyltransferase [Clostridium tetani]